MLVCLIYYKLLEMWIANLCFTASHVHAVAALYEFNLVVSTASECSTPFLMSDSTKPEGQQTNSCIHKTPRCEQRKGKFTTQAGNLVTDITKCFLCHDNHKQMQ